MSKWQLTFLTPRRHKEWNTLLLLDHTSTAWMSNIWYVEAIAPSFLLNSPSAHITQKPLVGRDKRSICCLCCKHGVVSLKAFLERTAYCCGESIRLRADIDNQSEESVRLKLKLVQVRLDCFWLRINVSNCSLARWLLYWERSAGLEQGDSAYCARVPRWWRAP